jgi:hypothetical protein
VRDFVALRLAARRQDRHEGLGERALSEKAAQQVRDAEGDVEGVGGGAGAEGGRDQLLADQAGHPGGQCQQRNGGGSLEQVHARRGLSLHWPAW